MPRSGVGNVLLTRCELDCVERAPVGKPLRCPAEVCGARHSRDLVHTGVARTDSGIRCRVLDLGGPPVNDALTTLPDGSFS